MSLECSSIKEKCFVSVISLFNAKKKKQQGKHPQSVLIP